VAQSGTDLSLKRYRFTGKERDDETGLYYFGVRYYAAWLGRWTSTDPGGFVDGLNLYVYVRNNPVNGVDELGYETEPPPVDPSGATLNLPEGSLVGKTFSEGSTYNLDKGGVARPEGGSVRSYQTPTEGGGWITHTAMFHKETGAFTRYQAGEEEFDADADKKALEISLEEQRDIFMAIYNVKRDESGTAFAQIVGAGILIAATPFAMGFAVEYIGVTQIGRAIGEEIFTNVTGIPVMSFKGLKNVDWGRIRIGTWNRGSGHTTLDAGGTLIDFGWGKRFNTSTMSGSVKNSLGTHLGRQGELRILSNADDIAKRIGNRSFDFVSIKVPKANIAKGLDFAKGLGKNPHYTSSGFFGGMNCTTCTKKIMKQMGIRTPVWIRTPKQFNNYLKKHF